MTFDVWDPSKPDVTFRPAEVSFPAFEFYKEQARKISEYIRSVEVTEENVKDVKKELAQARAITDELSRRRIAVKKEILAQFDGFEEEVKELSGIISEAEAELRGKVYLMEEMEREEKKRRIIDLWNARAEQYQITELVTDPFDRWFAQMYLNKTVTMKMIEKEMVDWLEETERDINTARKMGEEYLVEYLRTLDLRDAIASVNERNEIQKAIAGNQQEDDTAVFVVSGEKDIKLTEMLLTTNKITFTRR